MKKCITLMVAVSAFFTFICGCSAGEKMQSNKPFYKVHFKSQGVIFGVVVNGIEAYLGDTGRPTTLEIPVNQFVRTGANRLELQLHTWEENDKLAVDSSAFIDLEYRLYPNTVDYPHAFVVLNRLKYSAENEANGNAFRGSSEAARLRLENNELVASEGGNFVISTLFREVDEDNFDANYVGHVVKMQTPFPEWAFLNSDPIPEHKHFKTMKTLTEGLIGAPFKELEKIHAALSKRDIDSIMPMFRERNEEMDKAYYYEPGTYEKMLRDAFEDKFEKDLTLDELSIDIAKPMVSPSRKIMQLGNDPLIRFHDGDKDIFFKYDIYFRKDGDNWIITR